MEEMISTSSPALKKIVKIMGFEFKAEVGEATGLFVYFVQET